MMKMKEEEGGNPEGTQNYNGQTKSEEEKYENCGGLHYVNTYNK